MDLRVPGMDVGRATSWARARRDCPPRLSPHGKYDLLDLTFSKSCSIHSLTEAATSLPGSRPQRGKVPVSLWLEHFAAQPRDLHGTLYNVAAAPL